MVTYNQRGWLKRAVCLLTTENQSLQLHNEHIWERVILCRKWSVLKTTSALCAGSHFVPVTDMLSVFLLERLHRHIEEPIHAWMEERGRAREQKSERCKEPSEISSVSGTVCISSPNQSSSSSQRTGYLALWKMVYVCSSKYDTGNTWFNILVIDADFRKYFLVCFWYFRV